MSFRRFLITLKLTFLSKNNQDSFKKRHLDQYFRIFLALKHQTNDGLVPTIPGEKLLKNVLSTYICIAPNPDTHYSNEFHPVNLICWFLNIVSII